jgi:hypothetical protein
MAKKIKVIYETPCCKSEYWSKDNGLWYYHVCKTCGNKTEPKKVDMRLKSNKLKYAQKKKKI